MGKKIEKEGYMPARGIIMKEMKRGEKLEKILFLNGTTQFDL